MIPIKKNRIANKNPLLAILCCNNSTKDTKIITPAENPIIKERNRGFGLRTKKAKRLPIVVDNPANKLNNNGNKICSIIIPFLNYFWSFKCIIFR